MQKQAGILCAVLAIAGCQKREDSHGQGGGGPAQKGAPSAPPQSAEEMKAPLAKIDNVTITIGEFEERINRQSPYIRARYTSLEDGNWVQQSDIVAVRRRNDWPRWRRRPPDRSAACR